MNFDDEDLAIRELRKAVEAGPPVPIAQAAMVHFWPLFSSHFDEFVDAVGALPGSLLDRHPPLRVFHPITPVLARTVRPCKPMIYADDARAMSPDQLDVVILSQVVANRFSGDVAAALTYARRLEDRIQQMIAEGRYSTDGPLWYYHFEIGSTSLAGGDTARALQDLATARQLGHLSRQPDAERLVLGRSALAHAVRGSLDDAEAMLTEAMSLGEPSAAHRTSVRTTERTLAALIAVERLTPDVEEHVARLEPCDSAEFSWPHALLARSRMLLADQRPDEAFEVLRLAGDAHVVQHGSFASDVIAAETVKALCAMGDVTSAWRIAESPGATGILSQLAIIQLALHDSRLDQAAVDLRKAMTDYSLAPGHRAKLVLLAGWLRVLQNRTIDESAASHILHAARNGNTRRILAAVPAQVTEQVRQALTPEEALRFDEYTRGLVHLEAKPRPRLTPSELRVLVALSVHPTTAAIATEFNLSPNTIKSQLKSLYQKLGCTSRETAIQLASRHRFFDSDHLAPSSTMATAGVSGAHHRVAAR